MVYLYNRPPSNRQLQVSEKIRSVLADLFIKNEVHLPFLDKHMFTVSTVKVSADLKLATVFVVAPQHSNKEEMIKEINYSATYIRKLITPRINLKYSPQIRFALDNSIDYANKVEEILDLIKSKQEGNNEQ